MKISLWKFAAVLSFLPALGRADALELERYLAQVKQANPTVKSARFQAEAQESRIRPAGTWDDPFFAIGPDQIPFDGSGGSMLRFQVSQTLPFPGKLGARQDAAEGRYHALLSSSKTTEREVTVLATQAFYRGYYNRKSAALNQVQRDLLKGAVESTKARYQTGAESSHHEWLLARVEVSLLEVEKLRLDREWKTLQALLNELRNQAPETEVTLTSIDFTKDVAEPPAPDLSSQPELEAANASLIAAESEKRSARLSLLPDFVLQGMAMKPLHGMGMGTEKSNWGVMVGITVPLFFWRKQLDLSSAAESSRLANAADKQALENRLKTEVTDAKEQLRTANEVVSLYKKDVIPTTEIAAKNAKSAYIAKRASLNQFIEALRVQRTQELELVAAQIDVRLAQTRLREVLSSPPVLRLAPSRPTLLGSGAMNGGAMGTMGSDTVNMGRGMSGPTRKGGAGSGATSTSGGGMQNMGGM